LVIVMIMYNCNFPLIWYRITANTCEH